MFVEINAISGTLDTAQNAEEFQLCVWGPKQPPDTEKQPKNKNPSSKMNSAGRSRAAPSGFSARKKKPTQKRRKVIESEIAVS